MKPSEVENFLRCLIRSGWNEKTQKYVFDARTPPVIFHGPPGVGKTEIPYTLTAELGGKMYDKRLLQCDPTELTGLQVPKRGRTVWFPTEDLPIPEDVDNYPIVVLLFDELLMAPVLTQSAAFQILRERRVGITPLPTNCLMLAATNSEEDNAPIHDMSDPLRTRFLHIEFEPDLDDFISYAVKHNLDESIIAYLKYSPSSLMDMSNRNYKAGNRTGANPRTWFYLSRFLTNPAFMHLKEGSRTELINGLVGEARGTEFRIYTKVRKKMPDIDAILRGKSKDVPEEISVLFATVAAVGMRAELKHLSVVLDYAAHLVSDVDEAKKQPEFVILLLQILHARFGGEMTTPELAKKLAGKLGKYLVFK